MSVGVLFHLASGLLENTPVFEHGASIKILSKCLSDRVAASETTVFTLVIPSLSQFSLILFILSLLISTARISPEFPLSLLYVQSCHPVQRKGLKSDRLLEDQGFLPQEKKIPLAQPSILL